MATTDNSNPLSAYGYDQATGQQLAQSLGITPQQLAAALATTPQTGGGPNMQGGSYGKSAGFSLPGADQSQTIQQLQAMKAAGGLGGGQNQDAMNAAGTASLNAGGTPLDLANRLGAAALNMPMIRNPVPGQGDLTKGGIQQIGSPQFGTAVPTVPTGPWNTTAGVFGNQSQVSGMQNWAQNGGSGNPADAAAIEQKNGWAPGTIAQQFGGITTPNTATTPNAQGQLPGTPTGVTPPNAPGSAPATPWATAPPAPGASAGVPAPLPGGAPAAPGGGPSQWSGMAAHASGLENAGKAMYAHFGGDPNSATHADIANFHSQLVGTLGTAIGGGPVPGSNFTAGVNQPPNTSPPAKMATGGFVPGRGNQDTVPALLTPGEYVIPKQQTAQIFGGRTPIRMATGGMVPDDQKEPPEVRKQRLAVAAQQAQQATQPNYQPSQSSDSSSPSVPSLGGYTGPTAAQITAQNQAANNAIGSGGRGSLDSLGNLGDEGLIGSMGVGVGSGPGSGMPTQQAAGVVGGLASGLAAAAKAYADSIKPWQVQASHIPTSVPNYQTVNFQQEQT